MAIRRLFALMAAIGLILVAAIPVAANDRNRYGVHVLVTGPSPDADLVNGWGISRLPTSPWWVADNGTDLSTLYNGRRHEAGARVADPQGAPDRDGVQRQRRRLPRRPVPLLQRGRADLRLARRPRDDRRGRQRDHAGDAVYKGLAIATADVGGHATYLYATDFHNGRVDVFDSSFASQTWPGAFTDPKLPKGYAPFGIQDLKGLIFVTYAKTQPGSDDEAHGPGLGVVDVFLTDGTFFGRVARGGGLNAPWGLAWAPSDFGAFSGDLLVGNFGDGEIHAFARMAMPGIPTASSGATTASRSRSTACGASPSVAATPNNGPTNTLFFAAGPNDEAAGAFGTVTRALSLANHGAGPAMPARSLFRSVHPCPLRSATSIEG